VLLSRHRLQRLRGAGPTPCISAALASPKHTATVLVAEAAETAAVSALAAETAAFAAIAIATAEPAQASAPAMSSAAAFPLAAFAARRAAAAVPSAGSTPIAPVSSWCGLRVHQHLLQQLWLV
jgi:hypothetical protein